MEPTKDAKKHVPPVSSEPGREAALTGLRILIVEGAEQRRIKGVGSLFLSGTAATPGTGGVHANP